MKGLLFYALTLIAVSSLVEPASQCLEQAILNKVSAVLSWTRRMILGWEGRLW